MLWNLHNPGAFLQGPLHLLYMLDPATDKWQEWHLPGSDPMPYTVYTVNVT
jgi:streptogramin lyase